MSCFFDRLPVELLHVVFDRLDLADMFALERTERALKNEMPAIYCKVLIARSRRCRTAAKRKRQSTGNTAITPLGSNAHELMLNGVKTPWTTVPWTPNEVNVLLRTMYHSSTKMNYPQTSMALVTQGVLRSPSSVSHKLADLTAVAIANPAPNNTNLQQAFKIESGRPSLEFDDWQITPTIGAISHGQPERQPHLSSIRLSGEQEPATIQAGSRQPPCP